MIKPEECVVGQRVVLTQDTDQEARYHPVKGDTGELWPATPEGDVWGVVFDGDVEKWCLIVALVDGTLVGYLDICDLVAGDGVPTDDSPAVDPEADYTHPDLQFQVATPGLLDAEELDILTEDVEGDIEASSPVDVSPQIEWVGPEYVPVLNPGFDQGDSLVSQRGFRLKPIKIIDLHDHPLDWNTDANPQTGIGHLPVAYLEIGGKLHQIFLTVWYRRADTPYAVWMHGVKQVWRGADDVALIEDTLQPVETHDVSLESVAGDLLADSPISRIHSHTGAKLYAVTPKALNENIGDWRNDHEGGGGRDMPEVYFDDDGIDRIVFLVVKRATPNQYRVVTANFSQIVFSDHLLWIEHQPAKVIEAISFPAPSVCNVQPVELIVMGGGWVVTDTGREALAQSGLSLTDKGRRAARRFGKSEAVA